MSHFYPFFGDFGKYDYIIMEATQNLLAEDAKIEKVKKLLPADDNRGAFFLPDDAFYEPPRDNAGLASLAKQIAAWIGFKPRALDIAFSCDIEDLSVFVEDDQHFKIFINQKLARNAYACAALLSENLMKYFIEQRKHFILDDPSEQDELIMVGVVYAGLGLVMLNNAVSYSQQHYPRFYFHWQQDHPTMARAHVYAGLIEKFADDYGLNLGMYAKYLCPWGQLLLPSSLRMSKGLPRYVARAQDASRNAYAALYISLGVTLFGIFFGLYIWSQRPATLPLSLRQEKEEIQILKDSYELCNDAVAKKQRLLDESDFFEARHIDAQRGICTSIRNTYNSRVDAFNKQVNKQ